MRCEVTDTAALEKLLRLFFGFERPEIAGFRAAVEQFKSDLPAVLDALRSMIETAHEGNPSFRMAEEKFLVHAQEAINPAVNDADVREMLIQHILTEDIFINVFDDPQFHQDNVIARELTWSGAFFTGALDARLRGLEGTTRRSAPPPRRSQPPREAEISQGALRELLQERTTPKRPTGWASSTRPTRSCAS